MIIPPDQLTTDALQGLIEEFITREGTDYGIEEVSLSDKIEQVKYQLLSQQALIIFDPVMGNVNLVTRDAFETHEH